jgi:hypothetical protein
MDHSSPLDAETRRPDSPQKRDFELWHRFHPSERELLWEELLEARVARRRTSGWVVKALLGSVVLMMVFGNFYLAAGALVVGIGVEVIRQVRLASTIRRLWRALRDPMDGS